jgi:hypothetical protein
VRGDGLALAASLGERRDDSTQRRQVVNWHFVDVSARSAEQVRERATRIGKTKW